MEETIRQSQVFLQTVIDSIPDPMLVIDRDHRTVLANRAAREMAGETDPVSRCLTCYWLAHQRDLPCADQNQPCPLQQVVASKAPTTVKRVIVSNRWSPIDDRLPGEDVPEGPDWDKWLGQAPADIPFNGKYVFPEEEPGWSSYRAFSGGFGRRCPCAVDVSWRDRR